MCTTRAISSKPGEEHTFHVVKAPFVGSYASVWFDKPNRWAVWNNEVPGAPRYYIAFTWREYLTPERAQALLHAWLAKRGLFKELAVWAKTFHIKYFYQGVVDGVDGHPVGKKYVEFWQEFNWDGRGVLKGEPVPVGGNVVALSGLEQYPLWPFRIVGRGAVHPLGRFGWILLRSSFKYQYLVKEVKAEGR